MSMKGSTCNTGDSETIVSTTPCSTMLFDSCAACVSVRAIAASLLLGNGSRVSGYGRSPARYPSRVTRSILAPALRNRVLGAQRPRPLPDEPPRRLRVLGVARQADRLLQVGAVADREAPIRHRLAPRRQAAPLPDTELPRRLLHVVLPPLPLGEGRGEGLLRQPQQHDHRAGDVPRAVD